MEFRCARILLISHWLGCLEHPAAFITKARATNAGFFFVRRTYTTPAPFLAGFGPADDRFAQAFHQPFQVRHAFAEFTKLGAQRIDFPIQAATPTAPCPAAPRE